MLLRYIVEDQQAIVMMGAPASGKTTWVKQNAPSGYKVINPDDINKAKFGGKNLAKASVMAADQLSRTVASGKNFILDGTAANPDRIRDLVNSAKEQGYSLSLVYIKTSLETALRRNVERHKAGDPRILPNKAIEGTWERVQAAYKKIKNFDWDDVTVVDND